MNDRKDVQCYRCEVVDICGKPGASFKFDDHGRWVYADDAYKVIDEQRVKIAALRSEIDAMRAGAESYKRRIAELEKVWCYARRSDVDAALADMSRGALPCQPGSVEFVPFAKKGVDNRPTMQELRDIIQDYAPKDYVYCMLKMLSRCGMVK